LPFSGPLLKEIWKPPKDLERSFGGLQEIFKALKALEAFGGLQVILIWKPASDPLKLLEACK
jgi:hypothetical protein